ncbi:MAG TPA: PEP-CTERM sorting domain-containing protein [Tepidisphaeraceae bacterium]|jgi:fibronectin-binding autotransporter adhesin
MRKSAALAAAVLGVRLSTGARAAILSWDGDGATAGAQGGEGTWTLDATNVGWHDGVGNVSWTNNSIAYLGGTGGAVTVSTSAGALTADGLIIDSPGYSFTGGSITMNGGMTINSSASFSTALHASSSLGIVKWGAGTMLLSQPSSLATPLFVNEGTVRTDSGGVLSQNIPISVAQGAALYINANTSLGNSFASSGVVTIPSHVTVTGNPFGIYNVNGGTFDVQGTLNLGQSGRFNYNAGKVNGTVNVPFGGLINFGADTAITGSGHFLVNGTSASFSGNLPSGATLSLAPTNTSGIAMNATWLNVSVVGGGPTLAAANSGLVKVGSSLNNNGVSLGWTGTLTNSGTFSIVPALGSDTATRSLSGIMDNRPSGVLDFQANGAMTSLLNSGTVSVAAGKTLTVTGNVTQSAGTMNLEGILAVPTFSYTGGLISGTVYLSSTQPLLSLGSKTASGGGSLPSPASGTFVVSGNGALISGNVPAGVTLRMEPGPTVSGASTFSLFPNVNNGTVALSSFNSYNAISLSTSGSTFTNNGTFTVSGGPFGDGTRTIASSFTNSVSGSASFNASTTISGTVTNQGRLTVPSGKVLYVNNIFNQSGGTLTLDGALAANAFNYSGGSASGNVSLAPSSSIIGSNPAGLTLTAIGSTVLSANVSNTYNNAGALNFTSNTLGASNVSGPTIANTGTVNFLIGSGGSHTVSQSITNAPAGTVTAGGVGDVLQTVTNSGQFTVLANRSISTNSVFQQKAGTLTVDGTLTAGQFSYTGGTINGANPVRVAGSLSMISTVNPAKFQLVASSSGSVANAIPTGIDVALQPSATFSSSFSWSFNGTGNAGTVTLASPGVEQPLSLSVPSGYVNSGIITTLASPNDAQRTITGTLVNDATGIVNTNAKTLISSFSNAGTVNVKTMRTVAVGTPAGSALLKPTGVFNVAAGATLDALANTTVEGGSILLASETFTPAKLLLRGDLNYTGTLAAAHILSGNVAPGDLAGTVDLNGRVGNWNIGDGPEDVDVEVAAGIGGGSTAGIVKLGAGKLLLSGKNSFGGKLGINDGVVVVNGNNALGAASAVLEFGGGTLVTSGAVTGTRKVTMSGGSGNIDTNGFNSSVGNIDGGSGDFNKLGAGKLTVNRLAAGNLKIAAGRIDVRASGAADRVSYVNTLSLAAGTTLDLNDNDLVVSGMSFGDVRNLVMAGYSDSVDTSKTGLISSKGQTAGNTILALFDNALVGATDYPFGSGTTISSTAIVGVYTVFGDADLNGQVTADDYLAVDSNLGRAVAPGEGWISGDFDFSGTVTPDDYIAVDSNLGRSVNGMSASGMAAAGAVVVPEPGAVGVVMMGVGMMGTRRRRQLGMRKTRNA